MDKLFYSIQINEDLLRDLSDLHTSQGAERNERLQRLSDFLTYSYYANSKNIDALFLLDLDSLTTFKVNHNTEGQVNQLSELNTFWSRLISSDSNIYFEQTNALYAVHSFNSFINRQTYGGVAVEISPNVWQRLFEILEPDLKGDVFVFNDDYFLMKGSSENDYYQEVLSKIRSDSTIDYRDGAVFETSKFYHFIHEVDESKLLLVKSVPLSEVLKHSRSTFFAGLTIILIACFLSVLLALLLSHRISQPITALTETMKEANIDGIDFKNEGIHDEVVMLKHGYNEMLTRLKHLIKEEYQHEIDLKNAQLLALQTQINPHFLNNALNLIGGIALEKGVDEIYHLTISIGKQLRYTLKTSDVMVTLEDEINHIKHYLSIQEARFQDRCQISLDIPETLLNIKLPKMILQPVVENAFEHGLQSKVGQWQLRIEGRLVRNRLMLAIIDNGVGMSTETLSLVRQNIKQSSQTGNKGVGLRNVHSRLKLRFGPLCGLKIFSKVSEGTMMILTLGVGEANV